MSYGHYSTAILSLAILTSGALAQDAPAPVFENGESQVVDAFKDPKGWIVESLWVEAEFDSDGDGALDRMYVDVTRPGQTKDGGMRVPVIYNTSPYFWGTAKGDSFFWDPKQELGDPPPAREAAPEVQRKEMQPKNSERYVKAFVPRGFAVVHSSSPGTGYSQGCPTVGGQNESLAPKAVIDWLNGRAKGYTAPVGGEEVTATSWCTGKVGMIGTSYNGTLPLAAATTGVEGLEAILPVAPNTSYYHYYRSNGLVRHPGGYMGEDIDILYDFIHSGDPARRPWCNENVREKDMKANQDRQTGDYSDWWAARDYGNQLENVRAAVLMAHAFNDWNVVPEHSVRIYEALKANGVETMSYFHQKGHGGDPPFWMVNQWFTKYLYGVDGGILDGPRAWIVREGAPQSKPTPYADYPNPLAQGVTLYPTGGGNRLSKLEFEPQDGKPTLVDDVETKGGAHAAEKSSDHRLLFATPKLRAPVHLSGHYDVKIRLASSKPAANLSVWLVSLPWVDGGSINENIISRGWADPQNAKSMSESAPLTPGQFVDLEFRLQPDDQIIPVGERIGLMIFSTDPEFTLLPDPGTELTVDLAGTSITLPVVGGKSALRMAFGER